ncbi:MAG: hypothetical protein ABJA16_10190, partial [Nakamurella sp.]
AKTAGDKEAAAAIAALRKPTRSAFTINRLARTDPDAIDALVEVGTELHHAQTAGDGKRLRELNSRRRQLLDRLTGRAFEIIGRESPTAGQRDEVTATLTAALADLGIADQLRQGILVRAAESAGFGFSPPELTLIRSPRPTAAGSPGPARAEPAAPAAPESEPDVIDGAERTRRRAGEEAERAAATQRRRDREQAAHDTAVAAAVADAEAADTAVQEAVDRMDAAQQLITRLQRELSTARRALEEAQKRAKVVEQKQKSARAALNKVRA